MSLKAQKIRERGWLVLTGLISTVAFILLCFLNYRQMEALSIVKPSDFVLNHEILANTAHGRFFENTKLNGVSLGNADHFSLTSCLLVPFFWISDSINLTNYLATLIVILTIIPVYLLVQRLFNSSFWGFIGVVTYLLLPETQIIALNGLWMGMLEIPLLASAALFLRRGNRGWFAFFSILTMMCREEYFIIIGLFAVTEILTTRRQAFITIPIVLAIGYGLLLNFISPTLHDDRAGTVMWFFQNHDFPITGVITDLGYFVSHLSPILLVSLLSPARLIPILPAYLVASALMNISAPVGFIRFSPGDVGSHYLMTLFALMVMTSIESIKWLVRRFQLRRLKYGSALALAVLAVFWTGQIWDTYQRFSSLGPLFFIPTETDRAIAKSIACQENGIRVVSNVNIPYLFIGKASLFLRVTKDPDNRHFLVVKDDVFNREFLDSAERRHEIYEGSHVDWSRLGIMVRPDAFNNRELKRIYTPFSPCGLLVAKPSDLGLEQLVCGGLSPNRTSTHHFSVKKGWEFSRIRNETITDGFITLTSNLLAHDLRQLDTNLHKLLRQLPKLMEFPRTDILIFAKGPQEPVHALMVKPGARWFWLTQDILSSTPGLLQAYQALRPVHCAYPYFKEANSIEVIYASGKDLYAHGVPNGESLLLTSLDQPVSTLSVAALTSADTPFIIAAERSGLIHLIDRLTLEHHLLHSDLRKQSYFTANTAADVDDDGDQDLLFYDLASFSVQVWKNEDNLVFKLGPSFLMGPLSRFVQVGDIDADGCKDLLTCKSCFLTSPDELDAYLRYCKIDRALVDGRDGTLSGWLEQLGWQRQPISNPFTWYFKDYRGHI